MHEIDISQLKFIHPMLRLEIMPAIKAEFGPQKITSLYRIGDTGVHGTLPLRGIDLRYNKDSYKIMDFVIRNWIYDPKRPALKTCMVHDVGGGIHVHLQVHPDTVRAT